jgi:uncharacterized protein (UPF0218 family)
MFRLPEAERHLLKKPFGTLYPDLKDTLSLLTGKKVYAVGDVVTKRLLHYGIIPTLAIIDQRSMRAPCGETPSYQSHRFSAPNPPGMITNELIDRIKEALLVEPSIIIVDGEEDLAVIPVILQAPEGGILLYGQPHEGIVFREINTKAKKEAEVLLSHFVRNEAHQ